MSEVILNQSRPELADLHDRNILEKLRLNLSRVRPNPNKFCVFLFVAHPDDEYLGFFCTISALTACKKCEVFIAISAASNPERAAHSQNAARAMGVAADHVFILSFADGRLPSHERALREVLEQFDSVLRPSLILTHRRDIHSDHAAVSRVIQSTMKSRPVTILHGKIEQPTATPWCPNVIVRTTSELGRLKCTMGPDLYSTEGAKSYFDPRILDGNLAQAGNMAGVHDAEAFEASQILLGKSKCGRLALALRDGMNNDDEAINSDAVGWFEKLVLEPSTECDCCVLVLAQPNYSN